MPPIQFLLIFFAVIVIIRLLWQLRHGRVTLGVFFFWIGVWGAMAFVSFLPQTTSLIANLFGVGRGVDAMIYLAIAGLFYLVFRLYIKIEEGEKAITKLVRHMALEDLEKNKNETI